MEKLEIYMYPKNDYKKLESPNPYVLNLEKALAIKHEIVNKRPNNIGIIDLYLFLNKSDVYFFNWIEDLAIKKFGKIQAVFFIPFIFIAKGFRKKILWVLHNKYSHEQRYTKWNRFLFSFMIKKSDLIITHSQEGVDFVGQKFPEFSPKVKYLIHPIEKLRIEYSNVKVEYDFFIWGTIHPYKGVINFLEFVRGNPTMKRMKIVVAGICPDFTLKKKIKSFLTENILYIDEFLDMDYISKLANQSKFVLFTYNSDSILSSGSLMDTIGMGSIIIGPMRGVFKDLSTYDFIETYSSFEDILEIYERKGDVDRGLIIREVEEFYELHNWRNFAYDLFEISDSIL